MGTDDPAGGVTADDHATVAKIQAAQRGKLARKDFETKKKHQHTQEEVAADASATGQFTADDQAAIARLQARRRACGAAPRTTVFTAAPRHARASGLL